MTALAPTAADPAALAEKLNRLNALLRSMGRVLIGYSGGVDSAMLAVAAHRVLGENAIAVTADSESYATGELEAAFDITQRFGIRHLVVRTSELDNPEYVANPSNRCYFCKQELFTHMQRLAGELKVEHILYGQNADDAGDFRPGSLAARDYGVRAPLMEAGLTKADIRELARRWEVPVWNRPAMACLSSRFPYGTAITTEGLRMVDQAENFLRQRGFSQLRVRHHVDLARIELPAPDLDRLLADPGLCAALSAAFAGYGYRRVTADLRGFRSGSMNEALLPAPAQVGETLDRARRLLVDLEPCHLESREQMLCLQLGRAAILGLSDPARRQPLVSGLEDLGYRYLALDLTP
ncbi:MAG: ATP-dependent sacrificial sulfur transferase LarE [Candidatus Handelsmanbacteria bacterium]|nr:ATP-dependent sacrificial sulfur transferase LarE [Candidatus Handelsmanbacteria bacterium]